MKKRILLSLFTVLILGLGVVAFAFTTSVTNDKPAMSCCSKSDSCPMKNKDNAGTEKASCCDNCDCCKGDACPMKKKDGTAADKADHHKGMSGEHKSMSDDHKNMGEHHAKTGTAAGDGKSCDCACCKAKAEKKDV